MDIINAIGSLFGAGIKSKRAKRKVKAIHKRVRGGSIGPDDAADMLFSDPEIDNEIVPPLVQTMVHPSDPMDALMELPQVDAGIENNESVPSFSPSLGTPSMGTSSLASTFSPSLGSSPLSYSPYPIGGSGVGKRRRRKRRGQGLDFGSVMGAATQMPGLFSKLTGGSGIRPSGIRPSGIRPGSVGSRSSLSSSKNLMGQGLDFGDILNSAASIIPHALPLLL